MPSSAQIVADLSAAANGAIAVAALWHLILAVVGLRLALGWRPSQRRAGQLLAAPLASVALVAFAFKNSFNGIVFLLLAIALLVAANRSSRQPVRMGPASAAAIGVLMLGMSWVYPHFLQHDSWLYLLAAPLGVVPCATLYAVIGFALLGATSRAASYVLAGAGLFYGIFGVVHLGVRIDLGLVIGAGALSALHCPRPFLAGKRPA